jgi:uncharacterized membrane protein
MLAFVFDDPFRADEARAALLRMAGEGMRKIDETAVLFRRSEKDTRVTQDADLATKGKGLGRILGTVAASVVPFAVPLGMVLGSKIADAVDKGISNKFIDDVRDELRDGASVLILMARDSKDHSAQIIERLRPFHPRILESELSPELDVPVSKALEGTDASART